MSAQNPFSVLDIDVQGPEISERRTTFLDIPDDAIIIISFNLDEWSKLSLRWSCKQLSRILNRTDTLWSLAAAAGFNNERLLTYMRNQCNIPEDAINLARDVRRSGTFGTIQHYNIALVNRIVTILRALGDNPRKKG